MLAADGRAPARGRSTGRARCPFSASLVVTKGSNSRSSTGWGDPPRGVRDGDLAPVPPSPAPRADAQAVAAPPGGRPAKASLASSAIRLASTCSSGTSWAYDQRPGGVPKHDLERHIGIPAARRRPAPALPPASRRSGTGSQHRPGLGAAGEAAEMLDQLPRPRPPGGHHAVEPTGRGCLGFADKRSKREKREMMASGCFSSCALRPVAISPSAASRPEAAARAAAARSAWMSRM